MPMLSLEAVGGGLEWIMPMPIEHPETVPPPDFLQHLHFRDKFLMARPAFLRRDALPL
jgi:hypothetical protein